MEYPDASGVKNGKIRQIHSISSFLQIKKRCFFGNNVCKSMKNKNLTSHEKNIGFQKYRQDALKKGCMIKIFFLLVRLSNYKIENFVYLSLRSLRLSTGVLWTK